MIGRIKKIKTILKDLMEWTKKEIKEGNILEFVPFQVL